jgi:hypothetical protein
VEYSYNGYHPAIKTDGVLIQTTTQTTFQNVMLSEETRLKRPHSVWFHLDVMPEEANQYGQKIDYSSPGLGMGKQLEWNKEGILMGIGFFLCVIRTSETR